MIKIARRRGLGGAVEASSPHGAAVRGGRVMALTTKSRTPRGVIASTSGIVVELRASRMAVDFSSPTLAQEVASTLTRRGRGGRTRWCLPRICRRIQCGRRAAFPARRPRAEARRMRPPIRMDETTGMLPFRPVSPASAHRYRLKESLGGGIVQSARGGECGVICHTSRRLTMIFAKSVDHKVGSMFPARNVPTIR